MPQVVYLHAYLEREWHPKTIVIEQNYVDADYLGDYTSFYATAYAKFDRFCKRVHFFVADFDDKQFEQYILRENTTNQEDFEKSYLGFTVVRPLPQAIIGRTLLRTYRAKTADGDDRHYRAVRNYTANLFGLRLEIPHSLPFQQQDSVVAACATVALWSAFHKTSELFHTAAPRPSEITRSATTNVYQERVFPSSGLTVEQICDAIRANGLEPEVFRFDKHFDVPILSWLRAYLDFGIPLLLGIRIPRDEGSEEKAQDAPPSDGPLLADATVTQSKTDVSLHAVTILGYRVTSDPVREREMKPGSYEAPSIGRRMTELYCHDDNFGPFAAYYIETDKGGGNLVLTSDYGTGPKPARIEIDNIIAPVYHKIRLPFPEMQKWISLIDNALQNLIDEGAFAVREWDVRLIGNRDLKDEIRQLTTLTRDDRLKLIASAEPRFLWSAVLTSREFEVVRVHADATSIARSLPIRHIQFATQALHENVVKVLDGDEKPEAKRLSRYLAMALSQWYSQK